MFDDFAEFNAFREQWEAVSIRRQSPYSLFTFGESELPYFLLSPPTKTEPLVRVLRGRIKITRPLIITADNAPPEFRNFFDDEDDSEPGWLQFLLQRSASFSHLRLQNEASSTRLVSDNVEELVATISAQLDRDEEDRVAILVAPVALSSLALVRYAAERIWASAPDNHNELRERGFLP